MLTLESWLRVACCCERKCHMDEESLSPLITFYCKHIFEGQIAFHSYLGVWFLQLISLYLEYLMITLSIVLTLVMGCHFLEMFSFILVSHFDFDRCVEYWTCPLFLPRFRRHGAIGCDVIVFNSWTCVFGNSNSKVWNLSWKWSKIYPEMVCICYLEFGSQTHLHLSP